MRIVLFGASLSSVLGDIPGACIQADWYDGSIPWGKQNPRAPWQTPDITDTAGDCCNLCNNETNRQAGCRFWSWSGPESKKCYMKATVHRVHNPRDVVGFVSGSIYPWEKTTTTTTTTAPPAPPPMPIAPPTPPPPVTEPVKVFILLGQSNMLGEGNIEGWKDGTLEYAVQKKGLYSYLVEDEHWKALDHMRNVFVMGSGDQDFQKSTLHHNEWMTVDYSHKTTIGPELGIGFTVANYTVGQPVMMLKSCIGNRALGWDLLPPGSKRWEYTDGKNKTWVYAGYHDSPMKWEKGTEPTPTSWKAGIQWDGDISRAESILADLDTYYPGGSGVDYQVAGFFWWQGDKDSRDAGLSERYEFNLVNFIKTLRTTFKAPDAKFVTASLGQTAKGATGGDGKILDAMLAVDGKSGKYPEFAGNVAAVYTHPLSKGGSSGAHYNKNAETYMNVGEAMGDAMVNLLKSNPVVSV